MTDLERGARVKLETITPARDLIAAVSLDGPELAFDISCFGLDKDQKLTDDRYFVFFNQPSTPESAIVQRGPAGPDQQTFGISLDAVPSTIHRIVVVATIDGVGTFAQLRTGRFRLLSSGTEVARYDIGATSFGAEAAVLIAEIYRKDGWRLGIIGQGFNGGLEAVIRHFGGEIADAAPTPPPGPPPAPPTSSPPPAATPPPSFPGLPPPPGEAPGAGTPSGFGGALRGYSEPPAGGRFTIHRKRMLRVGLGEDVLAKQGSMVAYQGTVTFEHEGAGMKSYLKSKATNEGMSLMRVSGQGEVFLADLAADIYLIEMEGDGFSVNGRSVLALETSLTWDIKRVEGVGFLASGAGLFNAFIQGHGAIAIASHGQPVALAAPVVADPNAVIGWSAGLRVSPRRSATARSLIGRGSGEAFQLVFEGQGHVLIQPSER